MDHSIESTISRIQDRANAEEDGRDFDRVGALLVALMPDGMRLASGGDYTRARLMMSLISALIAYCDEWEGPHMTPEALADVAVYAAMLNSLDGIQRQRDKMMWVAATEPGPTGAELWSAATTDRIYPTPPDSRWNWWRMLPDNTVVPADNGLAQAPGEVGVAYYSAITDLYWGLREDAATWFTRVKAERERRAQEAVDSTMTGDEIARRRNYTPGT
jgi:hypothetical protein